MVRKELADKVTNGTWSSRADWRRRRLRLRWRLWRRHHLSHPVMCSVTEPTRIVHILGRVARHRCRRSAPPPPRELLNVPHLLWCDWHSLWDTSMSYSVAEAAAFAAMAAPRSPASTQVAPGGLDARTLSREPAAPAARRTKTPAPSPSPTGSQSCSRTAVRLLKEVAALRCLPGRRGSALPR